MAQVRVYPNSPPNASAPLPLPAQSGHDCRPHPPLREHSLWLTLLPCAVEIVHRPAGQFITERPPAASIAQFAPVEKDVVIVGAEEQPHALGSEIGGAAQVFQPAAMITKTP